MVSHIKNVSQKDAAALLLSQSTPGTVQDGKVPGTRTCTVPPYDHFPPLDYLEFDHDVVESLGIDPGVADALGIGNAAKGRIKGYVQFLSGCRQ